MAISPVDQGCYVQLVFDGMSATLDNVLHQNGEQVSSSAISTRMGLSHLDDGFSFRSRYRGQTVRRQPVPGH
jgi:hypothetical protein